MVKSYELKYFLNASHFVVIDGTQTPIHTHNWLIDLVVVNRENEILKFKLMDNLIGNIFNEYNDSLLNKHKDFYNKNVTTEEIGEVLYKKIKVVLNKHNCKLYTLKISENASRTYILNESYDG